MFRIPADRTSVCIAAHLVFATAFSLCARAQTGPASFTLRQALSAPYSTDLTPAPVPDLYAWVEDAEGRHNLWIGGSGTPARALTHNTEDDAQDISSLAWSPDAKAIAYTFGAEAGVDGKPANPAHLQRPTPVHIFVQPLAPGAPAQDIGEGRAPLFTHDARSLLFIRGGQVWIAELGSQGAARQLVFDRGSAGQLTLSHDGTLLAFTSTRRDGGHDHSFIGLFDLRRNILQFLSPSTGSQFSPAFSADDRSVAWLRKPFTEASGYAPNRTSPNSWSIELADVSACIGTDPNSRPASCSYPARTLFSPQPNRPGSVLPHLSTGTPRLFFLTDGRIVFQSEQDGWNHLYFLDPRSNRPAFLLTPGPYEVEDATLDRTGTVLYFAANNPALDKLDTDRRHLYRIRLDQPDGTLTPQPLTAGEGIETHPQEGATTFAGLHASIHEPMHPVVTRSNGIALPLHPNATPPDYPGARFVTPRQVLLRSTDGIRLHAQLFEPPTPLPAGHRRPAILFFHGGPNRQMMLGFPPMDYYSNAYAMNQYLASRGFVVLSVNYRCGIGYGLNFRQCLGGGPEGAREYNDALAGAAWLRARPDVDPKRIGIWGGSYGGFFVALALARNSNLFAAGVDFHGVHEWGHSSDAPEDWLRGSSADEDRRRALAHKSSPMADVSRWRSPVLLIHGDDDSHVAYYQTPMLADALRARNIPVEELIFPDEVHGFLLHRDWLRAYEATAGFFERKLQPNR